MSGGSPLWGASPMAKVTPKVSFESLTAKEAVWHVVVLILFGAIYLIVVVMVRFSLSAKLLMMVVVVGASGLMAVLSAIATTHRSSVLQSLRNAITSRDSDRIREAILRAQAAGVSVKDAADMQELREVLSDKLQSAHLSLYLKASPDPQCPTASPMPRATVLPAEPEVDDPAGPQQAAEFRQAVGMTAEEVAFAEEVLAWPEQDSPRLRVVVQRPYSPPAISAAAFDSVDADVVDHTGEAIWAAINAPVSDLDVPAAASPTLRLPALLPQEECHQEPPPAENAIEQSLRELHRAVEAGDAAQLREAISLARAACVSHEEVTLAEAVLQIEEDRLQRAALHGLRQAKQPFLAVGTGLRQAKQPFLAVGTASVAATVDDVGKLRVAVRYAQRAGVSAAELQAAEAVLFSAEACFGPPRRAQAALRLHSASASGVGTSPKKRVSFSDECLGICRQEA